MLNDKDNSFKIITVQFELFQDGFYYAAISCGINGSQNNKILVIIKQTVMIHFLQINDVVI